MDTYSESESEDIRTILESGDVEFLVALSNMYVREGAARQLAIAKRIDKIVARLKAQ